MHSTARPIFKGFCTGLHRTRKGFFTRVNAHMTDTGLFLFKKTSTLSTAIAFTLMMRFNMKSTGRGCPKVSVAEMTNARTTWFREFRVKRQVGVTGFYKDRGERLARKRILEGELGEKRGGGHGGWESEGRHGRVHLRVGSFMRKRGPQGIGTRGGNDGQERDLSGSKDPRKRGPRLCPKRHGDKKKDNKGNKRGKNKKASPLLEWVLFFSTRSDLPLRLAMSIWR
jgi:hypothetical protein